MISVCIATYNGENFIKEQIQSILKQLNPEDEIIVSDDNSNDNTVKIINELKDERITILHHKDSRNAIFNIDKSTWNFENAIKKAKGEYIFLSDQDDIWLDNKVNIFKKALECADVVMSDCIIVDDNKNTICQSYFKSYRHFKKSIIYNIIKPGFLGCCMAFNRNIIRHAIPFPSHGVAHDLWIGLTCLLHKYRFKFIEEKCMLYRRHNNTVTDSGKKNGTKLFFKTHYRLYILKAILKTKTRKS